jgi:hypothetical protein
MRDDRIEVIGHVLEVRLGIALVQAGDFLSETLDILREIADLGLQALIGYGRHDLSTSPLGFFSGGTVWRAPSMAGNRLI